MTALVRRCRARAPSSSSSSPSFRSSAYLILLAVLLPFAASLLTVSRAFHHRPSSSVTAVLGSHNAAVTADVGMRRTVSMAMSSSSSSWSDLRSRASSLPVGSALDSETDLRSKGEGSAFVQSNLRLFDSADGSKPKLTLYRDHAGWCPYCQKTMLLIEEKGVPINIELVPMRSYGDKPQSFTRLVPSGLLPALGVERDDGSKQIITESAVIMEILDRWHTVEEGYKPMMPPEDDGEGRRKFQRLSGLERELFSWWCTLTFRPEGPRTSGGKGGLMGMLTGGNKNSETEKEDMSDAMRGFLDCLDKVDSALLSTPGPFFYSSSASEFPTGDYPTMIDFVYASHIERMFASLAYWKGLNLRSEKWAERYKGINAWFDALERREYYRAFQSDYYTHVMDIPPQYGPGYDGGFERERREYSKIITGRDGKSWSLPLPSDDPLQPLYRGPPLPLSVLHAAHIKPDTNSDMEGSYLTCLTTQNDAISKASRHYAGWKLSTNGVAVSKFASRGGPEGSSNARKGFGAPLADPYAAPDEGLVPYVDDVLRVVCEALLEDESETDGEHLEKMLDGDGKWACAVRDAVPGEEDKKRREGVAASLAYLRDRVGVPRDMPLAAARQFRAHLNWAIDVLLS